MEEQDRIPTGVFLFSATVIDEETKQGVVRMFNEGASEADIHAVYPCYEGYVKSGAPLISTAQLIDPSIKVNSAPAVTFRALQVEFARLWQNGNILPESVTISEADYHAFAESAIAFNNFEQKFGDVAVQDTSRNITHIINHVNSGMVRLIRDEKLPTGAFSVGYPVTDFKWEEGEQ